MSRPIVLNQQTEVIMCLVPWANKNRLSSREWSTSLWNHFMKQKNLPVYMLFDSSYGFAVFRAHKVYRVERHRIAIEEYINRFDEFFEFTACHPFESASDALSYLNAVYDDTVPEHLIEFLLLHLPKPMEGGKNCYSLAVYSGMMANYVSEKTKIACSPGDLEKAQLDLVRNYCRQKLDAFDIGKSRKKRSRFQPSIPSSTLSSKNPKRRCVQMLKTK